VAAALEQDYDIVAYDARYHGLSDAADNPPEGAGADLITVTEKLGLESPAIMGHSMGAGAVLLAAGARPDLFRRAILEDPAFRLPLPEGAPPPPPPPGLAAPDYATMTVEAIEADGRRRNPGWHDEEWGPWARSKSQFRRPPNMGGSLGPPGAWRERLAKVSVPTLLIYGGNPDRGRLVSDEAAAEAKKLKPDLELLKLDRAGHNVRREAYDDFMAAVRAFLAR
jgi:pimeloyl-ACP methyl ester carboxylesterase